MAFIDFLTGPKSVSVALFLLCLSASYAVVVEIWSATVLFGGTGSALFIASLLGGVIGFYILYGWILYKTWKGSAGARLALLFLIFAGIAIHASQAFGNFGELFGPLFVTVFLDGLRIIAAVLLILSPKSYWRKQGLKNESGEAGGNSISR